MDIDSKICKQPKRNLVSKSKKKDNDFPIPIIITTDTIDNDKHDKNENNDNSDSDNNDKAATPTSPRHKNLQKFENLLIETNNTFSNLSSENIEAAPHTTRILENNKLETRERSIKRKPKRRRSRNLAKLSIHSASETTDKIRLNLRRKTSNSDTNSIIHDKPISSTSELNTKSSFSIGRFTFRKRGTTKKNEKPETLGKEVYGAKIVEETFLLSKSVSFDKNYKPEIVTSPFGWVCERPTNDPEAVFENAIVEFKQFESVYYITEFYEKDHYNYFATEKTLGNTVISLRKDKSSNLVRVIFRTKKGTTKMELNLSSIKKISSKILIKDLALNEGRYPNFTLTNLRVIDTLELHEKLVRFEQADIFKKYKFGVLLVNEGQTRDDEFFANQQGSDRYNEFLEVLGEKIELFGWKKYAGGLDTSEHSTGTHSVYRSYESLNSKYEIMYHVSTMLPFFEDDLQHVERKRHLGNDVVNIIFNDSSSPFDPFSVVTNFIHSYVVIGVDQEATSKNNETYYRVDIVSQTQVPKFNPPLRNPPIFSKKELYEWLPSKLINAERAAFLAPAIRFKLTNTRKQLLSDIFQEFS